MSEPAFDPHSVDVAAFARQMGDENGSIRVVDLDRLCGETHPDARPDPGQLLKWRAVGHAQAPEGTHEPQIWLSLQVDTDLMLTCQRCLQPVRADVSVQRDFRFVSGEDQAAELDADCEEDILALTRRLDLIELIEDELLLALPLVPRHEACPEPLIAPVVDAQPMERDHPFAILGELKRKPS